MSVAVVRETKKMRSLVKQVFRDTHTGPDNKSYDWAKVTGSGSILVYLFMCYTNLDKNKAFDSVQFSTGLCAILGVVCAGVAVKQATKSEPLKGVDK